MEEDKKMSLAEAIDVVSGEAIQQLPDAPVLTPGLIKEKLSFKFSDLVSDPSFWTLLASNVIAIFFIVKNHVPVRDIMLIYWMQSVIIGLVNIVRILSLKNFSTKDFKINGRLAEATNSTKFFTAGFFAVHYGLFHVGYLMFILLGPTASGAGSIDWTGSLAIAGMFMASHVFSFGKNFKQETEGKNIGTVMFSPYARIIPMHLAIVIGAMSSATMMTIFLIVKALVDILSHGFKHRKTPDISGNGNF